MAIQEERGGIMIRRYEEADHDQVWALHVAALEATDAYLGSGPWDEDLHSIEETYLSGDGEFLVMEEGERIIGMGGLRRLSFGTIEIVRMRVLPNEQKQGYGQTMLFLLIQQAIEMRCSRVVLSTTNKQVAAQRLYLKYGFIEVHREPVRELVIIHYEKRFSTPSS